jgi:hypothetical protein
VSKLITAELVPVDLRVVDDERAIQLLRRT